MSNQFTPRDTFLPFSPPLIGEEEIEEVVATLRSDWITTGPKTKLFEEEFTAAYGLPASMAVNSCTSGLHLALAALGVGPGDEVITTPHTFCATCNVAEHLGAKPVLADIEADTMNLDPVKVEAAITKKTKVIMPVHYAGHPANLDAFMDLAKRHNLHIVEDAAHAVSSKYKGAYIGTHGNPTAYSFYATKNLITSEGGMLTGTPEFIDQARPLGLHGMSKDAWKRFDKAGSWRYEVVAAGYKYNLTDIHSSMGRVQLKKMPAFQKRRREIWDLYNKELANVEAVTLPTERADVKTSCHLYVIRLNLDQLTIDRDQFIDEIKALNIGTSVHYIPIHIHPFYANKYGYKPNDFPVTNDSYERIISLPLHLKMTDADTCDVANAVKHLCSTYRR